MAWFDFALGILFGVGAGITIMAMMMMARDRDDEAERMRQWMQRRAEAAGIVDTGVGYICEVPREWFGQEASHD